ncbi:MAG: glutamate cyclase domain-containing protein [Alphaproteobacteria bacterium]
MLSTDRAIAEIEEICGRDIQHRNIGPLVSYARGSLAAASASIAAHPNPCIAVITGFFLCHGEPPNCETDGPPGAAMLAAGFDAIGIACRIATDLLNAPVMRATLAGGGLAGIPLDVIALGSEDAGKALPLETVRGAWLSATPPISHVIAIERCGPGRDGRARNALGEDISSYHAPLERLFLAGPWTTIGIGDLGNEIGMGSLPQDLVAASVPNGREVWCSVASDHPIVAGVSNVAAAALLGSLALLRPSWAPRLLGRLMPSFAYRLLHAAVHDGFAVSGARNGEPPRPSLAVDGIPWDVLAEVYRQIYDICRAASEITGLAELRIANGSSAGLR